jgi:hypothetical protein
VASDRSKPSLRSKFGATRLARQSARAGAEGEVVSVLPPGRNASVAKSAMKASADLVVSREVTAFICTTATETITTTVTEALNSTDRDLTLM